MLIECSAKYASTSEDEGVFGIVDVEGSSTCFFFLSFLERLEGDEDEGEGLSGCVSSCLRFFFFSGAG